MVRPSEHDRPDVAAARVAWHAAAPTWDVARLVFLDETGITTHLLRRYGRAPRGARVHDHAPCGRWQTSTFLAALRVTGLTAPGVFDGAIDGESVRAYIDQILVPTLHPGDIVIADTTSGPTRSPASSGPSRPPGPHSGTCHPTARTSIPSSSASRSSRPSFAPLAVAAPRRSGRSSASAWRTSALTNAATIFGTAGTRPPHGHEKRFRVEARVARRTATGQAGGRYAGLRLVRVGGVTDSRSAPTKSGCRRVEAWHRCPSSGGLSRCPILSGKRAFAPAARGVP